MANVNRPNGLSPVRHMSGAPYSGQSNLYAVLAADTSALAIGDPVCSVAGGAEAGGIMAVTLATAGAKILGVVVGIFDNKNGSKIGNPDSCVRPAAAQTKDWFVLVADDPTLLFEVQEANSGTPFAAADVGLNCNLVAAANNGFVSGWTLDNSTEAVTATLDVKLLGLVQRADNAVGLAARWLVKINDHQLAGGTGTAGI
jgi:hypothetical protein